MNLLYSLNLVSVFGLSHLVAFRVGTDQALHGGVGDEGGAVAGEAVSAERVAARGQHLEVASRNVTRGHISVSSLTFSSCKLDSDLLNFPA